MIMTTAQRLAEHERFNMSDDNDGSDDEFDAAVMAHHKANGSTIYANAGGDDSKLSTGQPPVQVDQPQAPLTLNGGNRLTVPEIERHCAEAQKREALLHDDAWTQIRLTVPEIVKLARNAVRIFNGMQELYFQVWNPLRYRESLIAQLERCSEPGELVALNAKLAAWNSTTPDVTARANAIWNDRVNESWTPLVKSFIKEAGSALKLKAQDVKARETEWLAKEFGMNWSPTPATVRILQIRREFDAFERNANEHFSNPLRNIPGSRLDLVGVHYIIGHAAYDGSLCLDEHTATEAN